MTGFETGGAADLITGSGIWSSRFHIDVLSFRAARGKEIQDLSSADSHETDVGKSVMGRCGSDILNLLVKFVRPNNHRLCEVAVSCNMLA